MKRLNLVLASLTLLSFHAPSSAVESGVYRLLSVSTSEKLILVSQIPNKKKYILDAASAKITVNGKAAEFKDLTSYSVIQLKMELRKSSRNGVGIDGSAAEIRVSTEDESY